MGVYSTKHQAIVLELRNPVSSDDDAVAEQDVVGRDVLARGKLTAESGRIGRLATLRGSEDEFASPRRISGCTGAGELLGTRQSGLPDMRLADLRAHAELLQAACDDARLVIERDPDLQSERGAALRALLYLFRRDDAVRMLRAG